jgi:5-methylcytosine-specific restriction enzyme subunit McrC
VDALTLSEYRTTAGVELTVEQRDLLRAVAPSIAVTPTVGRVDAYDLTPGSWIGSVHLGELDLVVRPKVPIQQVLFLVSYAVGLGRWIDAPAALESSDSLVEAIIPGFTYQLRRALARGVLQGYRTTDDSLQVVRGRWRIGDQVRDRFGLAPPIEVTFDEYTQDIEMNRLLRAAIAALLGLPVKDQRSTWGLRAIAAKLTDVPLVRYDPRRIPAVRYDRLTARYRPAVELARLILSSIAFDLEPGRVPASSFMIDMNRVFEEFIVIALREALGVSSRVLVQGARGRFLSLDEMQRVALKPDISLWDGELCIFVGDVKYKRLRQDDMPNADLYQLLAYSIAANLPGGILIYAAGEEEPALHQVIHVGKKLETVALDISGSPQSVLAQISNLAARIGSVAAVRDAFARAS